MAFFLKKDHNNPILVQDNRVVKNIIVSLIIFLLCLVIKKEIALNIFCLVVTDVCFHYDFEDFLFIVRIRPFKLLSDQMSGQAAICCLLLYLSC